jgi:hypothetical protein
MPPFGVSSGLLHQLSTAPIITAQNTDFCSAGGGVGSNLVLTGTNFTGATSVTVGGYAATIVSNTGTVLTVTTPADTANPVHGESSVSNVVVTTPHGTATTQIWFLPAAYTAANGGAWSMQDCTVLGGLVTAIADQSGNGYTFSLLGNPVGPTYFPTGGGSSGTLPYALCAPGTSYPLLNTSINSGGTLVAPEIIVAARVVHNPTFTSFQALFIGSNTTYPGIIASGSETNLVVFQSTVTAQTVTVAADFWADAAYSSSGASLAINGGAFNTTAVTPILASPGVELGGWTTYGNTYSWNGYIYQAFFFPSPLTTTDRTNFAAYFTAKGLG